MGWRAAALLVLTTADAEEKCATARAACLDDDAAEVMLTAPRRPARPPRPLLILPRDAPRRRLGSADGRIALLHALAHIELNAVDLAFDMALRFADEAAASGLGAADFVADWFSVGGEEASHFLMLNRRLQSLGSHYGALPAHDGLWEAAEATADSLLARLAIAPMVLEARGLDVTPGMAARLKAAGDADSAAILETIYADEIGHVRTGVRWFGALCDRRGVLAAETFAALVADRYRGGLKPPFNEEGRTAAGMATAFYRDWYGACAETAGRR